MQWGAAVGVGLAISIFSIGASTALAGPGDSIDFVTIGAPGNAPLVTANPNDPANGRGGVAYEYRIGRTEVNTALWVEFFNAAYDRPQSEWIPFLDSTILFWPATAVPPTVPGGRRWTVTPANANRPVGDITWRTAAIFCNWLCNGGGTERSAFLSGAYDVSTFGYTGNIFTDQTTHSPDARFWVPRWDEWLKAAHYDPARYGAGQGGYWEYATSSDTPPVYGPPGVGQVNAGYRTPSPFGVNLGSYPNVQSPWGLLDAAGETQEWTEDIRTTAVDGVRYRIYEGSSWGDDPGYSALVDRVGQRAGAEFPHVGGLNFGLRVASSVPTPGTCAVGAGVLLTFCTRRKRG